MKPVYFSAAMYQNKHQSDPNSVLHSIGATQGMGAAAQPKVTTDTTTEICPTQCAQPIATNPADEEPSSPHILKLMIPEDQEACESEDILQTTIESAKQIQQPVSYTHLTLPTTPYV